MLARPDIDLVVVCVRVPGHHALVMQALEAGKNVFCEWPLGANLAEAQEMASLANASSLRTAVGLQGRSDPSLLYVRELIRDGFIGEVLAVNFVSTSQAITERGAGRIWQGDRRNGANTLTIAGGHAIDSLCFVLGEFEEVSARLAVNFKEWHNPETGETFKVDSPDWISVSGRLLSGGQVAFLTTTVPSNPGGTRFEIYGREGTLVLAAGSMNQGNTKIVGSRGKDPLEAMDPPRRFRLVPDDTPSGSPFDVAQAYVRYAASAGQGQAYQPDFNHAVTRHALIEAIERSDAEHRAVRLDSILSGSPA
jgi:predicted dehydrogenase